MGSPRGGQTGGNRSATHSSLSNPCLCFLFFFCEGFMSSSVGSFRISDSLTANWKTWKRNPTRPVTPSWARWSDKWPGQVFGLGGFWRAFRHLTEHLFREREQDTGCLALEKGDILSTVISSWLVAFFYSFAYQALSRMILPNSIHLLGRATLSTLCNSLRLDMMVPPI